jgi:hypothetical protein
MRVERRSAAHSAHAARRSALFIGRAALNAVAGRLVGPVAEAVARNAGRIVWTADVIAGQFAVATRVGAPPVGAAVAAAALRVSHAPAAEVGAGALVAYPAHVGAAG